MNRCPVCRMPLENGLEFCPPTETMEDGAYGGGAAYVFLGCALLDMRLLSSVTVLRSGPRTGKVKHLTDDQRAEKAWGKDCILSEFGPLPTEDEIRAQPADYSAWTE